jgi:hypothetical protein
MNPESVYKAHLEAGTAWAEAHCVASQLEDGLKPLLSNLILMAKHAEQCSVAEATLIGQSADSYRDALKESIDARKLSNLAKIKMNAIEALFQAQRTVAATERAAQGHQA